MKYKLIGIVMALIIFFCALAAAAFEAGEGPHRVHQHLTARQPYAVCDCDGTELCTHLPLVVINTNGQEIPGEVTENYDKYGETIYTTANDIVLEYENGSLSMKYDEKFIYFYVRGDDYDPESDKLYIPIDITPKSGSTYCQNYDITFERPCDFVISIDGRNNSRIVVQERYEALKSTYWENYYLEDPYIYPPEKNSPQFVTIDLAMKVENIVPKSGDVNEPVGEKYETGILRYGNANPKAYNFDSLADFMFTDDGVEIRVPYELLNFLNPSEMMIHDDYYECYGIEGLHIDSMYVGFAYGEYGDERIDMTSFELEGWGKTVTYHERLKRSYYILRDYWAELDENSGKS